MRLPLPALLLLPALAAGAEGEDTLDVLPDEDMYASAARLIRDRYLFPETVTADCLFAGAVGQLTDQVEWLMVESQEHEHVLRYAEEPALAAISLGGMDDLPRALAALEAAVRDAGRPLDPDLELDVEILRGMKTCLDRHSEIMAGKRLERFNERISGKLTGIGVRYGLEEGEFVLHEVFADGPAAAAGLRADDILLRIDGVSTAGMTLDDVKERIQGAVGSPVALLVRRGDRELRFEPIRAEIGIPNLEQRVLPGGVGYLSIAHFSEQTVENLRRALAELASRGALERGLVLDLRGNTGGSLIQAARVADQFLLDGRLVRTAGRDGAPVASLIRQMDAEDEGTEPPMPLAVLVDGRTASASEIVAGDLALLDRAILIGQRTFGKGTVQKTYNLRPDVRFKLTVAEYLLPDDYSVAFEGLSPDVTTGLVTFDEYGARYDHDTQAAVLFVRERPGWRTSGEPEKRADPDLALAERIVLRARGPRREDALAATRAVLAEIKAEEDARLVRTYAAAGLDWSLPPEPLPALAEVPPEVRVRLEPDGAPRAGEPVTLRARVDNLGDEPLYRVRVEVWSQNNAWNHLTLPIGRIAPHGAGEGRRLVRLSPREAARLDEVSVQILAEGRPSPAPLHAQLTTRARPQPALAITGRLVGLPPATPGTPDRRWRAELTLRNAGDEALRGILARFEFPEDPGVELLDTEALLPSLAPGAEARLDLDLLTHPTFNAERLDLDLRVDADPWGRLLLWEFPLPLDGAPVRHEAPRVEILAPTSAAADIPVPTTVRAVDDGSLAHCVVYVNGHKLRFLPGGGRRLEATVPILPVAGSNGIVVIAEDDQGHRTRATAWVLGVLPVAGDVLAEDGVEVPDGEGGERP